MYCKQCGLDIGETAFCKGCGTPRQGGQSYNPNQGQMNQQFHGEAKSKIVAGILALLIGGLGIHNFYLGFTGKAIAQLLMSTIGWILIIPPIAAAIWALVEGIQILTGSIRVDARGIPLRD